MTRRSYADRRGRGLRRLDGTLTDDLGEPPERHELERDSVPVVQPGRSPAPQRRHDELVLFVYAAPPVTEGANFFDDAR